METTGAVRGDCIDIKGHACTACRCIWGGGGQCIAWGMGTCIRHSALQLEHPVARLLSLPHLLHRSALLSYRSCVHCGRAGLRAGGLRTGCGEGGPWRGGAHPGGKRGQGVYGRRAGGLPKHPALGVRTALLKYTVQLKRTPTWCSSTGRSSIKESGAFSLPKPHRGTGVFGLSGTIGCIRIRPPPFVGFCSS